MTESIIKAKIQSDIKTALKQREKKQVTVLRMVMAEIKQREVDERIVLDDAAIEAILDKMCKKRSDAAKIFLDGGRADLAEQERFEIELIGVYLPQALTAEQTQALINEAIAATQATTMKQMGQVIAYIKSHASGRIDMAAVSAQVKQRMGSA